MKSGNRAKNSSKKLTRLPARDQILHRLKLRGPLTATQLAEESGFTYVAIKKQLAVMEKEGMVEGRECPSRRGRPSSLWSLTSTGHRSFADGHGDFAASLISAVRSAFGQDGLVGILQAMVRQKIAGTLALSGSSGTSVRERLVALLQIRRNQGYMADLNEEVDGTFTFVEHHCPVEQVASVCGELCDCELEILQGVLEGAQVERIEHLQDGGRRCVYQVTPPSVEV